MTGDCRPDCPATAGFFAYEPSEAGNAVLLAAFAVLAILAAYSGFRSKTPLVSAVLVIGFLAEVSGFVGRILLRGSPQDEGFFFLFLFGTVLGPTIISAAIFIVLPHVLGIYGEPISPFRPLAAGLIFYILIAVALVLELVGVLFAAYAFKGASRQIGCNITAAGLGVQAATLLIFTGLHFWFTLGLSTQRGSLDARHSSVYNSPRFKRFLMALESASVLLFAYSIYRLVEFALELSGPMFQNQPAFMIVGGALPLLSGILLTVFHPGAVFGDAWAATKPQGLKRPHRPPPIMHPNGHPLHHRYDPNIRQQFSPESRKSRLSQASMKPPEIPAGSPGLPANPKPASKPNSPRYGSGPRPSPMLDKRLSEALEAQAQPPVQPPAQASRRLVDHEALW